MTAINEHTPERAARLPIFKRTKDHCAGVDRVKSARELYLPRPSDMTDGDYKRFLDAILYFPGAAQTLKLFTGLVFRKEYALEADHQLLAIKDVITTDGKTLEHSLRWAFREFAQTRDGGFLITHPEVPEGASQRDVFEQDIRPFLAPFSAESILEVTFGVRGGRKVLSRVRLREDATSVLELRLSRQEIDDALWLFLDIIRSDVTIVTLLDEMEYSRESLKGPMGSVSLIVSLFILSRAHEESATKARRLKEAWRAKRKQAVENKTPLTGVIPAWLRLDRKRYQVELIPERAAIVERIFRDTLSGQGQHQIAMRLNDEGVKPWGRGAYWHRSYIAKVLSNDAVIGTMTPHTLDYTEGKRTRTPQEPIKGYYPAAVSEALWLDVQAMRTGKVSTGRRGVHAASPVTHMLARLAMCPTCGGSMARVHKGSRSRPSLVCSRARTKAGCTYKSVRIDLLEEAIIDCLPERLRDAPAGERNPEIDRQILNLEGELERITTALENTLEAIKEGGGRGKAVLRMVDQLEGEYEETRDTLRRLEAQRAEVAGQTVQSRVGRLLGALNPSEGESLNVSAVNAAMLTVFRRVTVDYRHGVLDFEWLHGGSVELPYALPLEYA